MKRTWCLIVIVLIGCEKTAGSGFVPPPPSSLKPVAIVPQKMKVRVNKTPVTLDGSKSYDPAVGAPAPTFLWEQTAGTAVTLTNPTTSIATFTAPGTQGDLTFRLTVTGAEGTDTSSVTVSVKTFIVIAPEKWFVGYGKTAQTITPTLDPPAPTGSMTFLWTGLEPWVNATGLTSLTLTYDTPSLTDFQNFPDRAGVLLMERTTMGRLQLRIQVTDGADSDAAFVNVSVGPFVDSVANENVALGEPVFLNGGATIPLPSPALPVVITTWAWTGLNPAGSSVAFLRPNKTVIPLTLGSTGPVAEPFVYFVTDLPGPYQIQVLENDGGGHTLTKVIDITCGSYVGVGSLTGAVPDPNKGECAACHGGQYTWLADFANPWKQTAHSKALESILDPTNLSYAASQAKTAWLDFFNFGSEFSIDSRTVGWSRIATKPTNGWTEMATTEGCVLKGNDWTEIVRKHPKTAGKSNVQCESCHGPGSEHAGDSTAIRKSYDANVCGRCHSFKQDLWEVSAHGSTTSTAFKSASGSGSCNACHTAQGYIVEMRAQENAAPHPVLFAVGNAARPVLPLDDRRSVTCQACHEPHKKTVGWPETPGVPDPQLRAYGDVQFRNDAVAFGGAAAVCYMCHQSRTDTRTNSADMNVRRAPHDSTAAEMLSATNAVEFAGWTYNSSAHADRTRFRTSSSTENRQCLACHYDAAPQKGDTGYGAVGGHSFRMAQGDDTTQITLGSATAVAGTKQFVLSAAAGTVTLLKQVFPGDTLTINSGGPPDDGTYVVDSVDGARQLTVRKTTPFAGTTTASWYVTSLAKYNKSSCGNCHAVPSGEFRFGARADYDGNGSTDDIQVEIAGLLSALKLAIELKVSSIVGAATFTPANGRIKYTITAGAKVRTFPGPGVPASENPELPWAGQSPTDQATWTALYQAGYDWMFVTNDGSQGIHNTGYAVNLLQSAYKAVTGSAIGDPFVQQ